MAKETLGRNITFPIYSENGTPFHNLVLHKATYDSVVMSLGDKISGEVYYKDNMLDVTNNEYIEYKQNPNDASEQPVKYILVNPPTIIREGLVKDNGEMKGMTKYSFEFYHPMYRLANIPFGDVAVSYDENQFKSQDKKFFWIGYLQDFIDKISKNLQNTDWIISLNSNVPSTKSHVLSEVLSFDNNSIADALKTAYDTWGVPFVITQIKTTDYDYEEGKQFRITFGLPQETIYTVDEDGDKTTDEFVFRFGQNVGLKNNSRTPKNNKIVTRIAGYGSEDNIPYGYPQIPWYGTGDKADWDYTINNAAGVQTNVTINGVFYPSVMSYPIYNGIVGGQKIRLIKHPFTRTHLMPTVYSQTLFNKVSPYTSGGGANASFDPNGEIIEYYDAINNGTETYPHQINPLSPSYEAHEFQDIKPELGEKTIVDAVPVNNATEDEAHWNDDADDEGNYVQSYFRILLPPLGFDLYACVAITQEMEINMRSGACIGCTFTVQVDWEDYKANFYDSEGNFSPDGENRNYKKYPDSTNQGISVIVQKDTNTFGTLMPNIYQQPKVGDEFVFLGISLPLEYIQWAEQRLDEASKSYMLENNEYHYDYPLKFDEYFFATNTRILEQFKNNVIVCFKFGDDTLHLYIKQITIKYGQSPLPQYDIVLSDSVDVVLNQIGQVSEDVNELSLLVSSLRQSYNKSVFAEVAKKLSRVTDDVANGVITFARGLRSKAESTFEQVTKFLGGAEYGHFVTGQMTGSGARIDSQGKIEAKALTLREYLEVPELRFNRAEIIAGNTTQTPCGGIIDTVTPNPDTGSPSYVPSGVATLKLEDGEIGKIEVGDLCMGYWHNTNGENSRDDYDDKKGRMSFSGFSTVYFRISNIPPNDDKGLDNSDRHYFEYILRPECSQEQLAMLDDPNVSEDTKIAIQKDYCGNGIHPFPMMHFAGRGNSNQNEYDRQGFTIHTPNYTARLSGVTSWMFTPQNYTYVNGDLSGFGNLIGDSGLSGFGTIDMNLYMKGHIIQVENTVDTLTVSQSLMGILNKLETQTVTFTVMDGYRQDHTDFYNYRIERTSGNVNADTTWNSNHGNVTSPWTMTYADLGNANECTFVVYATPKVEYGGDVLSVVFIARKNNNIRYYLTLNTDLIHVDMNGNLIGNGNELSMTMGNAENEDGSSYLQLNGNYLTTGNTDNVYKIIARAWRIGSGNVVIANESDGLLVRATKYTGNISENGGFSYNGRLDIDVDKSCDKYIIELIDENVLGLVYDVKNVLIVRDGSASVIADFDDELGAGAASSDGTMLAGIPYTSIAHLYRGSVAQTLTNVELINANNVVIQEPRTETEDGVWTVGTATTTDETTGDTISWKEYLYTKKDSPSVILIRVLLRFDGTDATLMLTDLHAETPDNNKFGIRLTSESEANTAYFYFNKFKAGSDGHVTLFQLSPDTKAIKVDKNNTYSTSTVVVNALKIDVDETGQSETNISYADFSNYNLFVEYKVDNASNWETYNQQAISVGNATTNVSLRLSERKDANTTILWDTETIPVIKDGLDSSYIMKFSNVKIEGNINPDDERWHDVFRAGDKWAIMSSNSGSTWYGPYPIVGEKGSSGEYTEFSFARSSESIMDGDAETAPSPIDTVIGDNGWDDGVVAPTDGYPYIWMRTGHFVWDGTLNSGVGGYKQIGNYTYARVKGLDAPDRYEIEVSDTTFQIDSNNSTYTPNEIKLKAFVVKANGDRNVKEQNDWNNGSVKLRIDITNTSDVSSTVFNYATGDRIANAEYDATNKAILIKALLTRLNVSIPNIKTITVTCDFSNGTTVVGSSTQTINVLRNGKDGSIAIIADVDDEMISIPVDYDGTPYEDSFGENGWTVTARLYRGTETLELDTANTSINGTTSNTCRVIGRDGLTLSPTITYTEQGHAMQVTVTGFDANVVDTLNKKLTIQLVDKDHLYIGTCYAYINKIPAGEGGDGKNAVLWELQIDTSSIKKTDNTFNPSAIGVQIRKTDGDTTTLYNPDYFTYGVNENNKWVIYAINSKVGFANETTGTYNSNTHDLTSQSLTIPSSARTYIHVALWRFINGNATIIDAETIPVLKDGETPSVDIDPNDNTWIIDGVDTGISAKGNDGASVSLVYGATASAETWSDTYISGTHFYAKEKRVNGSVTTFGEPFRIVGENGENGDYIDYQFAISDSTTEHPVSGWVGEPIETTTAQPYLWMSMTSVTYTNRIPTRGNTKYVCLSGENGKDGKDGKDASAYEFIRFSDDATLENGVWTGTFTSANQDQITAKIAEQGDKKNLVPYSTFATWKNGLPVGWEENGSPTNVSQTFINGVPYVSFVAPSGDNYSGVTMRIYESGVGTNNYCAPIVANTNYTMTVRYKGTGHVYLGVHFLMWSNGDWVMKEQGNDVFTLWQEWKPFANITENEEYTFTMPIRLTMYYSSVNSQTQSYWHADFRSSDRYMRAVRLNDDGSINEFSSDIISYSSTISFYARIFLIHLYGLDGGNYAFTQPMLAKGNKAIDYTPRPQEELVGTTQGLWKGVLRWGNPYASTVFSDYEWARIRDAEPRMGTWGEGNCTHVILDGLPEEDKYFYCGAYGEPYYDIVYDGKYYWLCKKTYRRNLKIEVVEDGATVEKFVKPDNNSLWTIYWEMASQHNFLMAKTLYAIDAFIDSLVVHKLSTQTTDESAELFIENGMILIKSKKNNTSIKFGVDENGNAIQQYYDGNNLLYDLGPTGIFSYTKSVGSSWDTYTYISASGGPSETSIVLNTKWVLSTNYYRFNEGYAEIGNAIQYEVSGTSTPSEFNGKVYQSKSYNVSNYIPDGWYRDAHPTDADYMAIPTISGTTVNFCRMYRYSNGKLMQTVDYYFIANWDGNVGTKCDKNGNPIT